LKEDVYLVFQGAQRSADGSALLGDFTVYYNPLVMWVWIGGAVLAFGTVVALLPNKQSGRRQTSAAASREGEEVEHAVS
jgi:cytochrome c biogenesis factor